MNRALGGMMRGVATSADREPSAKGATVVVFIRDARRRDLRRRLNKYWMLYFFLAVPLGLLALFHYVPIYGANRLQRAVHITVPALYPIITILFILSIGGILNAGFDQIFNLYNPIVCEVSDIIDTYVYRVGLVERCYDFFTAVGLFKNVFGVALLLLTNAVVKRFSEHGIW